jgi:hypothetical protein
MHLLKMMIITLTVIVSTTSASSVLAVDSDVNLNFSPVEEIGVRARSVKGPDGESAIEVEGGEKPSTTQLIACATPEFATNQYVVRGQVKYEGVYGEAYLELLNDFGDKKVYFTRTLSSFGRHQMLKGTSDWREFELPFYAEPGMKPIRLSLNLILPGEGTVIVCRPQFSTSATSANAWWTNQQGGWIGGLAGCVLGILGGLIGLSTVLGKSRTITMGLCNFGLAIGLASLFGGVIAAFLQQPFHVFYPLMLIGTISVIAIAVNLRKITQRFQAEEFRRMQAIDAL